MYDLMCALNSEVLIENVHYNTPILNAIIGIKKGGFVSFCIVNLSFLKSETSLNYSTFDQVVFLN